MSIFAVKIKNQMKQVKLSFLSLLAIVFTFSACKYEEGPGISFVAKRDRMANEWVATNYTIDGNKSDTALNSFSYGDTIQAVVSIMRTGYFSTNAQFTKKYYDDNNKAMLSQSNNIEMETSIKSNYFAKAVGAANGKWDFVDKHSKVSFANNGNRDISSSDFSPVLTCDIIKLKNKEIKLSYIAKDGKKHVVTFEARNKENPRQRK